MWFRIVVLWLCAVLMVAASAPQGQAEIRLSIEDTRKLAVGLVQAGQPLAAREAALALLMHDPDDRLALLVLSRAARDLGLHDEATEAARRAHRLAPRGSGDRFSASLAMAQALASGGRRGLAQIWLRRAATEAPSEAARAVALRDLAYVRWRNPLAVALRFNAFPSSNVNGGPTSNVLVIGGFEFVDPDAVPLSGLGTTLGLDARLRLWSGKADELTLGVTAETTGYTLSDRAKALVPTARASDYATSQVALSFGWTGQRQWGRGSAQLVIGRDWRGGDALANWTRLRLGAEKAFGEAGVGDLSLDLVGRKRLDSDLRSSQEVYVGAGWRWNLASGDRVRVALDIGRVWSDAATVARRSAEVQINWQKAQPVLGLQLSAFASLEATEYEYPIFLLGVQNDIRTELGVTAVVEKVDVFGFAPEVGITWSRNDSNVAAMTTETAEFRLGIRSLY